MAFSVCRDKGSFYVLFEGGGLKRRIKKQGEEWKRLGFESCKTLEEAREWAKTLNAQDKVKRIEAKRQKIQLRLEEEGLNECAWLPANLLTDFETKLRTYRIEERHWSTAKRVIIKMGAAPGDWEDNAFRFYDFCIDNSWSLDYCHTIRRCLNAWGRYYTKKAQGTGYSPLPPPAGTDRNAILRAYEAYKPKNGEKGRARPSGRLSFRLLEEHKERFSSEEYNWLYISRAFGLRPEEIEKSLTKKDKHFWNPKRRLLHVYQYKLERTVIDPSQRWKKIPLKTKEQDRAIEMILSGKFKMPGSLEGIEDFLGRGVTHYGGRKDFFPVMAKKFGEAEASTWLGHRSIDTARRYYDDVSTNAPGFDEEDEDEEAA